MPYISIWIHLIWSTKKREPLLGKNVRTSIFKHIREYALQKGITLDTINGGLDHVHTLVSFGGDQSASKIAQLLKGESSHWVNQNGLIVPKLEWQEEYIAISLHKSLIDEVREYIRNQEEHHRRKSFKEEYDEFMRQYGFEILSRG